jgi:hypothetical protein
VRGGDRAARRGEELAGAREVPMQLCGGAQHAWVVAAVGP